jgi:hypothetical protein
MPTWDFRDNLALVYLDVTRRQLDGGVVASIDATVASRPAPSGQTST